MDLTLLERRGALRAIAALARSEAPLTAMEFVAASGLTNKAAQKLRDALHEAGVIDARVVREQGAIQEFEIRLTPMGHDVGKGIVDVEARLSGASRRARK